MNGSAYPPPEALDSLMKSQGMRMLDIWILGPLMIYAGFRGTTLPGPVRLLLVAMGGGVIGVEANNYAMVERAVREDRCLREAYRA